MNYYAYKGSFPLGEEPLGTDGKAIVRNVSERTAIKRATQYFGRGNFRLYRYSNFYDNKTFCEIVVK